MCPRALLSFCLSTSLRAILLSATPRFLKPWWDRLEKSPIGYRLVKGAFWSLMGTIVSRGLGLVASILVARMLGKEAFGELGVIQSTVGMFGAFAGLGLGLTATKYVAECRLKDPEKAGRTIHMSGRFAWVSGTLVCATMFFMAAWLARKPLAAPHLTSLLRIGSLLLVLGAVNGAQTGALAGFEAFRRVAAVNFCVGLANLPFVVGGALWCGLEGAVWGLVAALVLNTILNSLALRAEARGAGVPLSGPVTKDDWTVLWKFSLPATLSNLILGPVNWGCVALLVNRAGGYSEMGVYNVAFSWFNMVLFLPGVLAQVVLPVLSSEMVASEQGPSQKLVSLAVKANLIVVMPAVTAVALLSPLIMDLYGPGFRQGWPTMVVMLVAAVALTTQVPPVQAITAAGRMWIVFLSYLGWGGACVALTVALLRHGATGLAAARLAAYALSGMWAFWFVTRNLWTGSNKLHLNDRGS